MFIKLIIIAIVLLAIVMLAFGIRMLFDRKASFRAPSCALDKNDPDQTSCDYCGLTDLTNCPKKKKEDK